MAVLAIVLAVLTIPTTLVAIDFSKPSPRGHSPVVRRALKILPAVLAASSLYCAFSNI